MGTLIELEAFILVGGRSSRMGPLGHGKALLQIDGVTLAERTANTIAAALSPEEIYFVARDEKQFAAEGLPSGFPIIYDIYKDRGAYSGLHAALNTAKTEWILVLACDYPLVSGDLLKFLAELIEGAFDAVAPVQPDDRVQPLCAFYRAAPCLEIIESFLAAEEKAEEKLPPLHTVFEKVRTRLVTFKEIDHLPGAENFFLNLNTPEDVERL